MKRVRLILNPTSGRGRARRLLAPLAGALRQRGFATEVCQTRGPGDACEAARRASAGTSLLLAIGGDGTLNEVVSGNMENRIPVGVMPAGTANLLARELSLPWQIAGLVAALDDPRIFWLDAVRATSPGQDPTRPRYSLAVASAGFDATLVQAYSARRRGAARMRDWIAPGLREFFRFTPPALEVEVDGRVVERRASLVVAANTRHYGGPWEVAYKADAADGLLDVCIFPGRKRADLLRYMLRTFLGKLRGCRDLLYLRARELVVKGPATQPWQVDGDPGGFLPLGLQVVPLSVPILAPAGAPA